MQDPSGDKGFRAGDEEEGDDGQHTSRAPNFEASSQRDEAGNDHGNSPHGNDSQDSGSQVVSGSLDSRSAEEARVVVEEEAIAPQDDQAANIPGPSGDATTTAGSRLLEFSVTVPFRTALEANIACASLASSVQYQQVMIQQEFTVDDTILTVWTTDDPLIFRISINAFLDHLSLVMRNIQRPVFMAIVKQRRGQNNEP